MAALASLLGVGPPPPTISTGPPTISGREYLLKLRKYLGTNLPRLAPRRQAQPSSWLQHSLQQSYTVLTLGLDPTSAPLSPAVKVPLTLGLGSPAKPASQQQRPLLLRLPPDKLLYLLLRWQSLPQALPHVGHTDVPVPDGVEVGARAARNNGGNSSTSSGGSTRQLRSNDGDVESVRSWVGSIRTVSMPIQAGLGGGWWSKPQEVDEDKLLIELYSIFNTLPGLLIHPPFSTDSQIEELFDAGGYSAYGGVDVRVPLDVLRNLQVLELESFDPRGLIIPPNPLLHSLTVHDVPDADVWVEELLIDTPEPGAPQEGSTNGYTITPLESPSDAVPRFPNLRFLSLHHTSLLSLPTVPLDSLTHLDLSHNLLNAIPDALRGLHSLVSLNLAHNLITSVRNAPQALGNIHTINLAHNRIDCLVGLDRVPGLRRVDVRGNELTEPGEVGRLAVLPLVEAMWAAENPLAHGDDWRPEISAAFAAEGRPVVLDDTPLAWSEQRRVDAILASRGRTRAKERTQQLETPAQARVQQQGQRASPSVPTDEPDVPSRVGSVTPPTATAIPDRVSSPPLTASAAASPTKVAAAHRKRPRRRLVNLDGDEIASLNASTSTVGTTTTATPTLTPKTKGKKDGKKEKKDKSSRKNGNGNGSGNGSADSVAAKDSVGE